MKITVLLCLISLAYVLSSPFSDEKTELTPGHCRLFGVDVKEGERISAPVGKCYHATCTNATTNAFAGLTCSLYRLQPNSPCHISGKDLTKQYPGCCPKTICPEDYIKEQCYYKKINIKVGETTSAPIGECNGIKCLDALPNSYLFESCPIPAPDPICKYSEEDLTKAWPECCPKPIC